MAARAFDEAFERVQSLAATFKANETRYLSAEFQEAEARKDFVDKFFIALGWDVNHDVQTNPYAQEVKVERTSGASQRRADYAFYLAPNFRDVRFYVEAKKPYGDIATPDNYFQATRYGYGSSNPVAVLTDFQHFHILDCRYRPDIDTAIYRGIAKYHYSQYADREEFAKIYWLFSREAVAAGSIETFAKELPRPRGKAVQRGLFPGAYKPVDESLLEELDEYRKTLAHTFKNRNPRLDSETLTEITQRTLDRLVFLRFLEDKQIETPSVVDGFGSRGTPWEDFVTASRRLDGIYNGVVFKKHDVLDAPDFRVDEDAFADICERLSHVNSAYNFDAIPIHILGSIYERFLGKVIVATDKRVRVEEKPEVRKAGGVYYTPEYIVRYIVESTVGKLIAAKTPEQVAEMRFADIACGSGSFLLGVYDLLLQHHGNYYNANPTKARKGDCTERDGKLYLSLQKKREILLKNIYGVDVDSQAVEVCQLSLYLKLLKDETIGSTHQYLLEFEHAAQLRKLLPDLGKNIVCGNSLIGTDILEGQLFPTDQERKLNPMNFEDAFPEVTDRGGFDAIVGNPPYVRIQTTAATEIAYYNAHYSAAVGNYDIYCLFAEQANTHLRRDGVLGYILPHRFFKTDYGDGLRSFIVRHQNLLQVVDFDGYMVFDEASINTCVLILSRAKQEAFLCAQMHFTKKSKEDVAALLSTIDREPLLNGDLTVGVIPLSTLSSEPWVFVWPHEKQLWERMSSIRSHLDDVTTHVFQGFKTASDAIYIGDLVEGNRTTLVVKFGGGEKEHEIESAIMRPLIKGGQMCRYLLADTDKVILFPYDDGTLISADRMKREFPRAWAYLSECKKALENREDGKMKGNQWYAYGRSQALSTMSLPKIVTPDYYAHASYCFDPEGRYSFCGGGAGGYGIVTRPGIDPMYILGLLNSRLLDWYLHKITLRAYQTAYMYVKKYIERLPIFLPETLNVTNRKYHGQIVARVGAMLEAKKQLADARTDRDKAYYEKKCASLDRQIDRIVYALYGLTEEEIRVVEGPT
jgi:type I restriction-modification system DNA methylase subunit